MNQYICENCGRPLSVNTNTVVSVRDEGSARIFCKECSETFNQCPMCQHNIPCGFFNDPNPMPQFKVVSRTIRQDNATFVEQRQVPNTDRIKKFCLDEKCKCYNGDDEHPLCCRIGGCTTCTNYCELEQYKFGQDFPKQEAVQN